MPHSTFSLSSPFDQLREAAALPVEAAFSVPPVCYVDEGFFEAERREIFAQDWLCIGPAAAIPEPGDYMVADVPGAALMAVRQKDGGIKVLSRVCRHRAALVAEAGAGHTGVFTCPYHRWTYDLDGALRGAPAMEGNQNFHRADCALPTFTSEVWEGFVFVSLGNPAPLATSLAPLSGMLGEYGIGDWQHTFELDPLFWDINWKIAFENASESYHHIGFHPQTLNPALPGLGTRTGAGGDAYNFHVVPGAEGFRFSEVTGASLSDEAMSRFFICAVYPGFVLVMAGANAVWFAIAPLGVGRTSLRIGQLNPAGYFAAPGLEDRIAGDRAVLEAILEEDKRGCALVQRGLSMPDAVAGPLSPLERPIAEFVRYLARRLVR